MKLADIRRLSGHFQYSESAASQEQVNELLRSMGYDPANLYQELEMSSPLVDTHRDVSYSNQQMQLHSHTFYELLYCRNDCGGEYLIGSERYRMQRGDVIFVPPGVGHRPLLPAPLPEPYKRYVLWLSHDMAKLFASTYSPGTLIDTPHSRLLRTTPRHSDEISDLFRRGVLEAEAQRPGWQAAVLGNTITLLTRLSRILQEQDAALMQAESPELLDRVLAYIEENLSGHLTLADTAKHFYVSESTISQVFRKKLNVSFYHTVTQRRLIAAKPLILEGTDLEQVGRLVGFTDYSTFYRAFRKEFGIGPSQFRKLQGEAQDKKSSS